MTEGLAAFVLEAMEQGTIPLVMDRVRDPTPPKPDFFFVLMKEMVETSGEVTGCVTFATVDDFVGMVPHRGDVADILMGLLTLRSSGGFGRVTFVALGADTWHRSYEADDPAAADIARGDLQRAAQLGDERVTEALLALCYAPDGPSYNKVLPYARTPEGITWGSVESLPFDTRSSGDLPQLMKMLTEA